MNKPPKGMSYSLKVIVLAIQFIVFGRHSLRGASYTISLIKPLVNLGTPSYTTIQMWVLKYGLYLLNKPKEKRNDWIWILDHTIEYGKKKNLVVIGITLEAFRKNKCQITHKDITILDIDIADIANSESVKKRFSIIEEKVGTPIQIVSDGGGDLRRAIREFSEDHKNIQIIGTYDVTHKASLILKASLEDDERWKEFTVLITGTKRCLIHTILSFMAPPKPKEKSRWLNLEEFIKWAENALLQAEEIMNEEATNKYKDKVSWVNDFVKDIKKWRKILDMINLMMKEIKHNGLSDKTLSVVSKKMDDMKLKSKKMKKIKADILGYITEESKNLDGVYLGCSDIIESIFGRYKHFSAKTPMKEVGKAVLIMPIFTNDMNPLEVKEAMETITEQDVKDWLNENIGESLFAKRLVFCKLRKNKQKVSQEISENLANCA